MKPTELSRHTTTALQASRARAMRREMTAPEKKLWREMRARIPTTGTHFRRQVLVDRYIADFCAFALKLVVEVDGDQHGSDESLAHDAGRTARLEALGYRVLRFSNRDVMFEIESVLDTIYAHIVATPTPSPSPQGGGGQEA
jgi:very-short-patch-repair endonuclease